MKLLFVNDDGIDAPGIRALIDAFSGEHTVYVAAPDGQRSAVSKALTLYTPLRAVPQTIEGAACAWAVGGTPVDCVRLGLGNLVPEKPDMVISGINAGPNLGTDTLYSGTCAGAQEAALLGVPAIAMSLDSFKPDSFETAVEVTRRMLAYANAHPLPFGMFYNVNVPDLPLDRIRGYRQTGFAVVRYREVYEARTDPIGRPYYWAPRGRLPGDPDADSDDAWVLKGYVTVTPMGYDSAVGETGDLSDELGGER